MASDNSNNNNNSSNIEMTERSLFDIEIHDILYKVETMCSKASANYEQVKDSINEDDIESFKNANQWLCFMILVLNSNLSKQDKNDLIIEAFVDSNKIENLSATNGTLNESFPDISTILDIVCLYADNSFKNQLKGKLNKYKDKLK
jgi:hypothetical protein